MLAALGLLALMLAQPAPIVFPAPAAHPEPIANTQDFPFLPPLSGARLIQTSRVSLPLELKSATADDEAVLAGMSHIKKTYQRTSAISSMRFVSTYRDALFAAGWKLIDVTKLAEPAIQETVTVSAHYLENGRNIYARVSQEPDGPYESQRRRRRRRGLVRGAGARMPRADLQHPFRSGSADDQDIRVRADARETRDAAEGEIHAGG